MKTLFLVFGQAKPGTRYDGAVTTAGVFGDENEAVRELRKQCTLQPLWTWEVCPFTVTTTLPHSPARAMAG